MTGHHLQYQTIDVDVVSPVPEPDELSCLLTNTTPKGNTGGVQSIKSPLIIVLDSKWTRLLKSRAFTLLPSVLLGTTIWFGVTPTDELTVTAIHLLAVFSRFVTSPFFGLFVC